MTTEKKQMFTRRITQANKTQLTVIVYEMLSAYLEDAGQHMMPDKQKSLSRI